MPRKRRRKKTKAARERQYRVSVCKVSVFGRIAGLMLVAGAYTLLILRRTGGFTWGNIGLLSLFGVILLIAFTKIREIGKVVIRMSATELDVLGNRVEWDKIASVELRTGKRNTQSIKLTLTDNTTFTIEDGAYTRSLEQIYRQLRLRLRSP